MSAPGRPSPFAELARKRDLWWQFTVRTVELRHRGSYLGIVWALLNPLLMLGVYWVVFGLIFGGRYGVLPDEKPSDYVLALFLGLILFQLVAEILATSPALIVTQANLVKKVVFPLEVLPLAQAGASWFHFMMSFVLFAVGSACFGRGLPIGGLLWEPLILLPLLLLSVGIGWICAALGVFLRDLAQAMPFLTQVVLYSSAVFYARTKITPAFWAVLKWNPFLHTVLLSRNALLWRAPVDLRALAYTYAVGLAVLLLGRWLFGRLRPAFADVV